jgi:hypothetical protein
MEDLREMLIAGGYPKDRIHYHAGVGGVGEMYIDVTPDAKRIIAGWLRANHNYTLGREFERIGRIAGGFLGGAFIDQVDHVRRYEIPFQPLPCEGEDNE